MQNTLEHFPRVGDLVHDLAQNLETKEHIEDHLGVVGEDLILLYHLLIHAFVQNTLLGLVLEVLDALLQIRVLGDSLQRVVVGDKEVVLVSSVEGALVFVVEPNLSLDLLELSPFVVIDLLQHELLQFHPRVHSQLVLEDVLVCAHSDEAGALGHK